jgi:flagellar protein FlbT
MTLKLTLEPQEWFMVGGSKVVNVWSETAKLRIDGAGPILRQAHTQSEPDADTPAKLVYLAVQGLYLGLTSDLEGYFSSVELLLLENPSTRDVVNRANSQIAAGAFYHALREYRTLLGPQVGASSKSSQPEVP